MATLVRRDTTAGSTTNANTYASASFTPTAGDLLVVCADVATTILATPSCTASANGLTFTRIHAQLENVGVHSKYMFIANQLVPASPTAMTVTVNVTGDTGAGANLFVIAATGMSRVGTDAVVQVVGADNNHATGGIAPSMALNTAANSINPLIGFAGNLIGTGAAVSPPAGWTEYAESFFSTPTKGAEVCGINSGFSGSTVTWGSTMGAGAVSVLELDATTPISATDTSSLSISETSDIQADPAFKSGTETPSIAVSERASRVIVGQNNRLTNPSFEDGTHDWTINSGTGTIEVVDSDAHDGTKVLRVTATNTGFFEVRGPITPVAPPLYPFLGFGVATRLVSGSITSISLGLRNYNANATVTATVTNPSSLASTWERRTLFTANNTNYVSSQPKVSGDVTAGTVIEIDAVQLNELPTNVVPAFDPVSGPVTTPKSASDTSSISIADTSSPQVSLSRTDTASIAVADSSSPNVALSTTDTGSVAITDSSSVSALENKSASDTASLAISDASSSTSNLSRTDTASLAVADSSSLLINRAVTASDSASLTVNDSIGTLSVNSSAVDTASLAVADSSSLATAQGKSASDTSALVINEAASVAANVFASDTSGLSVADSSTSASALSASDTSGLNVTESASRVVSITTSDTASLAISETASSAGTVTASDTFALAVIDVDASDSGERLGIDSTSISISESSSIVVGVGSSDTSSIGLAETSNLAVGLSRTDTGSLGVTETTSQDVSVGANDTGSLRIQDSGSVGTFEDVFAEDSISLSLGESANLWYSGIVRIPISFASNSARDTIINTTGRRVKPQFRSSSERAIRIE